MTEKPDCYKCKWRGEVPGSAHSSCEHPKCKGAGGNLAELFAILGGGGLNLPLETGIKVRGNPHGIRNGWFFHPYNFDPVWLEECDGFEEKE